MHFLASLLKSCVFVLAQSSSNMRFVANRLDWTWLKASCFQVAEQTLASLVPSPEAGVGHGPPNGVSQPGSIWLPARTMDTYSAFARAKSLSI